MKNSHWLDTQRITTYIEEIFSRGVGSGRTGRQLHAFLQKEIASLAKEFFLTPKVEFAVDKTYNDPRRGLIDVVWMLGSRPLVAIEIDAVLRKKSLHKLLQVDVPILFWVYYGRRPWQSLVQAMDSKGRIQVLDFSEKVVPGSRKRKRLYLDNDFRSGNVGRLAAIRSKYPHAYTPWSEEQQALLRRYLALGWSIEEISTALHRQPGAIRARIKKLGLR